jgi:MOSC domain-containing protein YiiM
MIRHIFISPEHIYYGHHGQTPGDAPMVEVDRAECVAGRGIMGDRFFDYKKDYRGQITFFSDEVYEQLLAEFGLEKHGKPPSIFRRNVIVSGVDLNEWIGVEFEIDGVQFKGTGECSPCHWMNEAVCHGAEQWLKGRGGLRAQILTSGLLTAR